MAKVMVGLFSLHPKIFNFKTKETQIWAMFVRHSWYDCTALRGVIKHTKMDELCFENWTDKSTASFNSKYKDSKNRNYLKTPHLGGWNLSGPTHLPTGPKKGWKSKLGLHPVYLRQQQQQVWLVCWVDKSSTFTQAVAAKQGRSNWMEQPELLE